MLFSRTSLTRWAIGVSMAACLAAPTAAQTFPTKPISLIVPFSAGGATDVQVRALAAAAAKDLNGQIVVMNQPGVAGTMAGSNMARSAKGDGYTLAVVPGLLFRQPHLQKVNYDALQDFTYILNITAYSHGIAVGADAPWKSLKDLVDFAKANPGKVTYGTVGKGSTAHIAVERLSRAAGIEMTFVPFKSATEVYTALAGGHLDVAAEAGFGPMLDSGRVRLLAVLNAERMPLRPDVPTLKESGYDIVMNGSYGIAGPKGMDPAVVQKLQDTFHKAMGDPTFKKALDQNDQLPNYMDSKTYTAWAEKTYAEEKKFLTELDIKLE